MLTLPPLPEAIRPLPTADTRRLDDVFPDSRYRPGHCRTCGGRRSILWYAEGRDPASLTEFECPCEDQYLLSRRFLHSGVMDTYQRLGADDGQYLPEVALEAMVDYMDNAEAYLRNGVGLTVWGTRGNGKTLTVNLLAKRLVADGLDCYVTNFPAMLDAFAGGWRSEVERAWFNRRVRNVPFLVLDDLGREHVRGDGSLGMRALEEVIRHRTSRSLPTLLTTNLSPEEIAHGYGGHTVSLLAEKALSCHFEGVDRRPDSNQRLLAEIAQGVTRPVMVL